ncbi:MAG: dihydrodipicolinate synthase family protein, partial [Acidimicrobiia bacterium]
PAVNMDTGFVDLIDGATAGEVLARTAAIQGGERFVAGACVRDRPGDPLALDAYAREMAAIASAGGTPIVFPSYGLSSGDPVASYERLASECDAFLGFELGEVFNPAGRIFAPESFRAILDIPQCVGLKHSSLQREPEWDRLALRDEVRPEFALYTGNDLAIDMVMYGSDYLLGLSTFAPAAFAQRDRHWADGDAAFYELNDLLQFLGQVAFRPPIRAYKHSAAQFLYVCGLLPTPSTAPGTPRRPDSDIEILTDIARRLGLA